MPRMTCSLYPASPTDHQLSEIFHKYSNINQTVSNQQDSNISNLMVYHVMHSSYYISQRNHQYIKLKLSTQTASTAFAIRRAIVAVHFPSNNDKTTSNKVLPSARGYAVDPCSSLCIALVAYRAKFGHFMSNSVSIYRSPNLGPLGRGVSFCLISLGQVTFQFLF